MQSPTLLQGASSRPGGPPEPLEDETAPLLDPLLDTDDTALLLLTALDPAELVDPLVLALELVDPVAFALLAAPELAEEELGVVLESELDALADDATLAVEVVVAVAVVASVPLADVHPVSATAPRKNAEPWNARIIMDLVMGGRDWLATGAEGQSADISGADASGRDGNIRGTSLSAPQIQHLLGSP